MAVTLNRAYIPEVNSLPTVPPNVVPSLVPPGLDAVNSRKSILYPDATEDDTNDCDQDGREDGDCEITLS